MLGVGAYAFTRALGQLVEVGLLDITRPGGGVKGDCSLYALSERWRLFGQPGFVKAERKKARQSPAQRSAEGRFQKTESGPLRSGTTQPRKSQTDTAPDRGEDS